MTRLSHYGNVWGRPQEPKVHLSGAWHVYDLDLPSHLGGIHCDFALPQALWEKELGVHCEPESGDRVK